MSAYDAPYRIPFCSSFTLTNTSKLVYTDEGSGSGFGNPVLVEEDVFAGTQLVWNILPNACQVSTIVQAVVAAVLISISLIFNIMMLVASFASKPRPPESKDEESAEKHYAKLKDTVAIGSMFRASIALSGLMTCGLLIPFVGISGYELLFSSVNSNTVVGNVRRLTEYKKVACAFFHISISSSVYALMGAMIERWITIFGLNPEEYLEKKRKPTGMPSSLRRRRHSVDDSQGKRWKSHRKYVAYAFIYISWLVSIAFGVISVTYGDLRFLLFGEDFRDDHVAFTSYFGGLIDIPTESMLVMTIIYIACLYIPLVLLIFSLAITLCYLLSVRAKAESLESYEEACVCCEFGRQQIGSNHKAIEHINNNSTGDRRRCGVDPEYSHKLEHARQVTLNCQETGLNGVMTDSIQIENDDAGEVSLEAIPPPPDWIQYPSIGVNRYSTISAVQVSDLTQPAIYVSVDSARSYFGEASETRATLIYCAVTCLFLLPLCALLAFDVFGARNSIFRENSNLYFNESGALVSEENLLSPYASSSLGTSFLALFIIGGMLPFILLYNTSPPFQRGTHNALRARKAKPKRPAASFKKQRINKLPEIREDSTMYASEGSLVATPIKRSKSVPHAKLHPHEMNKSSPQSSPYTRRTQSLTVDQGWKPQPRPFRISSERGRMTIDERYELTELED